MAGPESGPERGSEASVEGEAGLGGGSSDPAVLDLVSLVEGLQKEGLSLQEIAATPEMVEAIEQSLEALIPQIDMIGLLYRNLLEPDPRLAGRLKVAVELTWIQL